MGCVVNGPGEAREADLGIAGGKHKGHLFIRGKIVRVVKEQDMIEELLSEAKKLMEEGVEARLAAADPNAEAEAKADREALFELRGPDVNSSGQKIERIRKRLGGTQ